MSLYKGGGFGKEDSEELMAFSVADVRKDLTPVIARINTPRHPDGRADIGQLVLQRVLKDHGPEGVMQFAEWAIHPVSGFLPQLVTIKPLPEEIEKTFKEFIEYLKTGPVTRRQALANMLMTGVSAGMFGALAKWGGDAARDKPINPHPAMEIGFGAGAALSGAVDLHANNQVKKKKEEGLSAVVSTDMDRVATAASQTLEACLTDIRSRQRGR